MKMICTLCKKTYDGEPLKKIPSNQKDEGNKNAGICSTCLRGLTDPLNTSIATQNEKIERIKELAAAVVKKYKIQNPTENTGANFQNDIFELNAYCWCEGSVHNNGEDESSDKFEVTCPSNFVFLETGYCADWYKHINRNFVDSNAITGRELDEMIQKCLDSL